MPPWPLCSFGLVAVHSSQWRHVQQQRPGEPVLQRAAPGRPHGHRGRRHVRVHGPRLPPAEGVDAAALRRHHRPAAGLVLAARHRANGARAWFDLGSFTLQPSELAKLTLILGAGRRRVQRPRRPAQLPRFVARSWSLALPVGSSCCQPDLGTASTFVVMAMGVLLVAPGPVVAHRADHHAGAGHRVRPGRDRVRRPTRWPASPRSIAPTSSRSTRLARGQAGPGAPHQRGARAGALRPAGHEPGRPAHGQGFAKGITDNGGYVSQQHTDFIFSTIAEQFGLLGAGVVLSLYLLILLRMLRIAQLSADHARHADRRGARGRCWPGTCSRTSA